MRSGFGLAAACLAVLEFFKIPVQKARVAIQGFGGLGSAAAYSLYESGAKIVGIADEKKCLISTTRRSIDIKALMAKSANGLMPKDAENAQYVVEIAYTT